MTMTFSMAMNRSDGASDLELVFRSAAGDAIAFEKLYEMYQRRVFLLCLRMLGNFADAEDMTQEVFFQLYRKADTFRGESAFTTWLHRLTVNQVLMYLRKRRVCVDETSEQVDARDEVQSDMTRPSAMPIVDRIALAQAISEISPSYRKVFVLHEIEGYNHEEIARMLGCRIGTSKSQLHKARMKLRRILCNGTKPGIGGASGKNPIRKEAA